MLPFRLPAPEVRLQVTALFGAPAAPVTVAESVTLWLAVNTGATGDRAKLTG
jgi:hypothetical protein